MCDPSFTQDEYGWPDHVHPKIHGGVVGGVAEDCRACLRCHLEAGYAAGFLEATRGASEMLADIRRVVAMCEEFETTGRLGAIAGYRHSTAIRDVLEPYWSRSATKQSKPASSLPDPKGQEPA